MRCLVRRNRLLQQDPVRLIVQLFPPLLVEKRVRRKKHQPGPTLAVPPRHLGQSQVTVRIGPEPLRVILDGPRCFFSHRHFVVRGRWAGWAQSPAAFVEQRSDLAGFGSITSGQPEAVHPRHVAPVPELVGSESCAPLRS